MRSEDTSQPRRCWDRSGLVAETKGAPSTPIADGLAIIRYHIVLIAMAATLAFGWLMTDAYPWALALVAGLDWFLINLLNRVTDLDEDLANGIQGTERVARQKRAVTIASFALLFGSFASHLWLPELTPLRIAVQTIGMAYNYRLVPTLRGMARLKELYFFKNFGSACIFVLTCFGYPLARTGWAPSMSWPAIAALVAFFLLFEITFEILYDLRDLPGDTAAKIPTYPVVHGPVAARRIIDALLIASGVVLVIALGSGALGVREGLMLAAPLGQRVLYPGRVARGLTSADCIFLTHVGSAELMLYLLGTACWSAAGLPANIYLR
jgi:4-hydroxybenzoate polyprenyltransferase